MMTYGPRRHDTSGTTLCDRCGRPTRSWSTSFFDGAAICRACNVIERAFLDNPRAQAGDETAVRVGDYSFPVGQRPPGPHTGPAAMSLENAEAAAR